MNRVVNAWYLLLLLLNGCAYASASNTASASSSSTPATTAPSFLRSTIPVIKVAQGVRVQSYRQAPNGSVLTGKANCQQQQRASEEKVGTKKQKRKKVTFAEEVIEREKKKQKDAKQKDAKLEDLVQAIDHQEQERRRIIAEFEEDNPDWM